MIVCSPFRGTQIVYLLGERADAAPSVHRLSVGSALAKCIHLLSYMSPIISRLVDLRTESRGLSYREMSLFSLAKQLWKSDWAESTDALPYDVTFQAADERESRGEGVPHRHTFYRSYVTQLVCNILTARLSCAHAIVSDKEERNDTRSPLGFFGAHLNQPAVHVLLPDGIIRFFQDPTFTFLSQSTFSVVL